MDKKLLEFIKQLSISDTKTLSQKTLKACEEVGELAKVVLPFENAFACKHRFVDRRAILEEVADATLTVMSVAYDLGFEDSDLEEMIKEKSLYWAELQARDRDAKFPVPYEIHVTVKLRDKVKDLEIFKKACEAADVKPIILDLQNTNGDSVMLEVMTSSIHIGNNASAYAEMWRIIKILTGHMLQVCREKIETVPWHPAAPSNKHANPVMPPNCYFESHLAVIATEESLPRLRQLASEIGCHLSRNIFKRIDETHFKIMVTYRRYKGVFEEFKNALDSIKLELDNAEFLVDKTIIEFSVYDSRVSHDAAWLKG